jgi:putative ABC transport system permease protein
MFRHFLKIGFRNTCKHRNIAFINIICLSLGITIFLLIAIYAHNELSVDSFHKKASLIYKVSYGNSSFTPGPLSGLLNSEFPEIQNATHIETHQLFAFSPVLNYNSNSFEIEHYYSADSAFFDIFDFKVIHGDINKALSIPFSIILTESEALRIFNSINPVGETVNWKTYQDFTFTVKAIIKDIPSNSSIRFNGLISATSVKKMGLNYPDNWGFTVFETYLLLEPKVNSSTIEQKLRDYLIDYYKTHLAASASFADAETTPLTLHSFREVYFNKNLTNDTTNSGNLLLVRVLITIGIFILLLSIINYVNLSTARASVRSKEIGIQKVVGSSKGNLVLQYLTETTIISFFAVIVGLVIANLLLSSYSQFMNVGCTLKFSPSSLLLLIPGTLLLGLIAGIYPAFLMSSGKIVEILKMRIRQQNSVLSIRYSLIIFQFFISITLIAVTFLIIKQINYIKNKDSGINREHIIYIKLPPQLIGNNKEVFRERLQYLPDVQKVAFSSTIFGKIEGLNSQVVEGKTVNFASVWVDPEFVELYGLQLIDGRFFSKEFRSDVNSTALLNEAAVKEFGMNDPFQIEIRVPGGHAKIVGIVKDFNFKSLHSSIEPMTIVYLPRQGQYANIKLSGKDVSQTLKNIGEIWSDLAPGFPFSYHFLDSSFDSLYKNDERLGKTIIYFSLIAITIAILGILSLSIFLCESRIKEIGIRKINGAKIWEIILMLNKNYVRCLLIAFIIATPVAWITMTKWLENFAYKTSINWWIFVLAGLIASFMALSTVSWQSWRYAIKNPIDALRDE